VSIQFNDADGTFASQSGKGINFGETIQWELTPLIKKSVTDGIDSLGNLWLALILTAVTISLFLAVFQGSLVSTWMLINSLQLIAHVPLIAIKLPANAHYFLLNFLSLARVNFEFFNSQIDTVSQQVSENELLQSGDAYYSYHLRSMGYHYGFVRNMLLIISIAAVIALVWVITAILQIVRNKSRSSEELSRAGPRSQETFMNNFMVRFVYEVFFELMICAFISVTNQEAAGLGQWLTSLAVIIVGCFFTLAVFSQFFSNGPYVRDTHAKGSLLASFWGVRALHEDVLRAALATEDKTVGLTKRDSVLKNAAVENSESNT